MPYYFKILLRNFLRHRTSSLINVIGLTTGLACALFIYLWVLDEFETDKFHENDARLYRVMEFQTYSNQTFATNSTPGVLAESLKNDFPEIQYAATTTWISKSLLAHENIYFKEEGFFVGEDFFNIFTYPLLAGNADQVLQSKKSICISRSVAEKFFGSVDEAVGKQIRYEDERDFIVSGVFENISPKSTSQFDFVLSFEVFKDDNEWVTDWGNNGPNTFIIIAENTSPAEITSKISDYVRRKSVNSNVDLFLKSYSEQYLYGKYTNGKPDGGRIDYVKLFSVIAIFILIIACINFMNLSTARASKRAHEIGVKKALGADRNTLIRQFIGEALLISGLSMALAIFIVLLLLPQFNIITEKSIVFYFDTQLAAMSSVTVFFTGIIAGSYPALYLTKFSPVAVLKGDIKSSSGEIWARKGLVIFQFTITIILLIGVFVIYQQMQYAYSKNLGYDRENVIFFNQDGSIQENSEAFLNELRKIPGVVYASSSSHSMTGQMNNTSGIEWRDKSPESNILFENFAVGFDFQRTMGFELATGRWFDKTFGSDSTKIVMNETAVKVMGFTAENAIGENIKLWQEYDLEIIGVLKDFHFQSIHSKVDPAMFRLSETSNIATRIQSGDQVSTINAIKSLYESFNPGFIFDYNFLDQSYQKLYSSEKRIATLSSYFAGFAILISCLGLFGLASFTAERRLKEIGIRKVLGASTSQIVLMLSNDFTRLIIISIFIALPISYYFMGQWLDNFAYKIELSLWTFVTAALVSLMIAWLTVSFQALKAANINPAKCLKDE
ncbi:MAG: FtsX-like permease family protein [Cyclobacteriaceae bacterium]